MDALNAWKIQKTSDRKDIFTLFPTYPLLEKFTLKHKTQFLELYCRLEPWEYLHGLQKCSYRTQRPQITLQLTGFVVKMCCFEAFWLCSKKTLSN